MARVHTAVLRQMQEDGKAVKRRFPRMPVSVPVIGRTRQFGGAELPGMVRHISVGGLMVEFPVEVVVGSVLFVVLQTRHGPLEVEGRVVWTTVTNGGIRHGLSFSEPKDPDFIGNILHQGDRGPAVDKGTGGEEIDAKEIGPDREPGKSDVYEGGAN